MEQSSQPNNLLSILHCIGFDVNDTLYDALHQHGCVSSARLVCREFCNAIDRSVRELRFTVWSDGIPDSLSLSKWPRSHGISVIIDVQDEVDDDDEPDLEAVAKLAVGNFTAWLGCQPADALERIKHFSLRDDISNDSVLSPQLAAAVALWLPKLEVLTLDCEEPDTAQHLRAVVRGGLGRLEHLQSVGLPSLNMLGALAPCQGDNGARSWGQLQKLILGSIHQVPSALDGLAGLASLRTLRSLHLVDVDEAQDLLALLQHLPPDLAKLTMHGGFTRAPLEAAFDAGQLVQVTVGADGGHGVAAIHLSDLEALAKKVLVPYLHARCAPLRRLTLRRLSLQQQEGGTLRQVGKLAQRCQLVELEELLLALDTPAAAMVQAVELLGWPQRLRLDLGDPCQTHLTMRPMRASAAWAAAAAVGAEAAAGAPAAAAAAAAVAVTEGGGEAAAAASSAGGGVVQLPLPPPREVLAAAADRLLASSQLDKPDAEVGANNATVLVLRGPLLHALSQAPQLAKGWVAWLCGQGAAARQPHARNTDRGFRCSHQLLPSVPALLLKTREQSDSRWLDEAVRSVAPGTQLEATWVAAPCPPPSASRNGVLRRTTLPWQFLWCLQQELSELLAQLAADGEAVRSDAGAAEAVTRAGALPALQEQVLWLQQLGRAAKEDFLRVERVD